LDTEAGGFVESSNIWL